MTRIIPMAGAWLVILGGMAGAEDAPLPLSLDTALERALAGHPALGAAALEVDIARSNRELAAQAPRSQLGLDLEDFAGGGNFAGFDSGQATLTWGRTFERGGKAALRGAVGDARVDVAAVQVDTVRLDVAAEVQRRFFAALAAQAALDVALAAREHAVELRAILERRVGVGRSAEAELRAAQVEVDRTDLDLRNARRQLGVARTRLAVLWGAESLDPRERVVGELFERPAVPAYETLRVALEESPELRVLVAEGRLAEVQGRLAEAQAATDFTVQAGMRYLSQADEAAFVMFMQVPIGQRERSAPARAAAAARMRQAPLSVAQRRRELVSLLAELHGEFDYQAGVLSLLSEQTLPNAEAALELYREGFELGGFSLLELNQAHEVVHQLRQDQVAAAARVQQLWIEIARLAGGNLTGDPS